MSKKFIVTLFKGMLNIYIPDWSVGSSVVIMFIGFVLPNLRSNLISEMKVKKQIFTKT